MQPNTDSFNDPKLFQDLNRRLIPLAAHAAVLNAGALVVDNGVVQVGPWNFPATPAYLIEIFDLIERYQREQASRCIGGALNYLRSRGCGEKQLQRIAAALDNRTRVVNLTPFHYRRRPVWRSRKSL